MHLVMFDLDGTLLQSNTLDVRCFSGALREVLGVGFYDTGAALRREGAACVFTDFSDRAAFLAKLNEIWND